MNESWRHFPGDVINMNFLTPGVHKKVRHIQTNLQVKAVGLFKYGWPFSFPLKSKTIIVGKIDQSLAGNIFPNLEHKLGRQWHSRSSL